MLATHTAPTAVATAPPTRHDWTKEEVQQIYDTPLLDLVFRSASVHRQHHDPTKIQLCTLMNIKSKSWRQEYWKDFLKKILIGFAGGGCSEDCEIGPIDARQGRAHVLQAHTARSRRGTRLQPRPPVS